MIPFSTHIPPLLDLEVELECTLDWHNGEPFVDVTDVFMGSESLFRHSEPEYHALFLQLAYHIADKAMDSARVMETLMEREGVYHVGGANNPDGRFVRPA